MTIDTPGFVSLDRVRALAAVSAALLYVRNPDALYQHKLVELLALDRPVLAMPEESSEAHAIAEELGARLISCSDASAIAAGLNAAKATEPMANNRARLARYTWSAQLQQFFNALEGWS